MQLGCLGPKGSFSDIAARQIDGVQLCHYPSFFSLFDALKNGDVDLIAVPIENSLEGSVTPIVDLLIETPDVVIIKEWSVPIRLSLMVRPGVKKEQIRMIMSHPQPLQQTKKYLDAHFPESKGISRFSSDSTSAAADSVKNLDPEDAQKAFAAIGHHSLATIYNLDILASDIQDHEQNTTRFLLIGKYPAQPTGNDKTTLVFSTKDRPGALFDVLQEFAKAQINLTSIFSRPAKTHLGEYVFWIECEGHQSELPLQAVLAQVSTHCVSLKILGSYPRMGE